jgi:two-component system LytT family sensor kinase
VLFRSVDIEQLRLGSRLRVSIEVDEGLLRQSVPPLVLQPIVENSVKYAVAGREEGGNIVVRGHQSGERCVLEVIDDGPGFDGQTKGAGFALNNIRQRLATSYGTEHRFSISRLAGQTMVQIDLPLAREEQAPI